MRRARALCRLAWLAALVAAAPAMGAPKPQRIVSLNLCTDELVLRLAEPERIASVTWLAQEPRSANMAAAAQAVPANHGMAEEVLASRPDLVVAGAGSTRTTVALLRRAGLTVHEFGLPQTLAEMRQGIAKMGALLGETGRAQALVAQIDAQLAALAAGRPTQKLRAVVLQPNGFAVGRGSLVDEILSAAGLVNIAAEMGVESYGRIALETLALGRADMLILNDTPDGTPSLAREVLHHPVIARLADRLRVVVLPARLWTCAGPTVVEAIERLVQAREAPR